MPAIYIPSSTVNNVFIEIGLSVQQLCKKIYCTIVCNSTQCNTDLTDIVDDWCVEPSSWGQR